MRDNIDTNLRDLPTPRKPTMQKTNNSKKNLLNSQQPTKQYRVNLTLPNIINLDLVDAWISQVLEIDEDTSCNGSDMNKLAYKALFIIKNLLQNSQIPAFYTGTVVNIISQDNNSYAIDLAIVDINFIDDAHVKKTVNFAFKVLFWMMKNEITPQNRQEFYKACLNEIINPITSVQPIGISRIHTLKAAYYKNIPFIHLGDGVYQLGWGSKAKKLDRSISEADSAIGSKLSQNKVNTANLLRLAGLPAPLHGVVNNNANALHVAKQLGYPVVVKPSDLDRGEGVSVDITHDTQLIKAFEEAFTLSKSKKILVEKQAKGMCHRLFVAQNELLYAVERLPISVKGDGIKTVARLIDEANNIQNARAPWLRSKPFPHDALAYKEIEKHGFSLHSVPKEGTWIPLRDIESTKWGGRSENVTEIVHPDNIDIAIRAAKLFGLNIAGIDIITADISQPWYQTGAIINEVNFAPMFGVGETSRSSMPAFFDKFIEGDGRIPLEIFVGEDEETLKKAKRRQQKLIKTGLRCYLSTAMITFDERDSEVKFMHHSILMKAQALLLNHNVDAVIFVVETEGIKEVLLERLG